MKKFKKILALALSLATVLGMSVTSFAEGSPKITVSGVPKDATVTYRQIATAAPTTPLGWALGEGLTELSNDVTLDQLTGNALKSDGTPYVPESDRGTGNAAKGEINSNNLIAKAIQNIELTKSDVVISPPDSEGKVTATINGVTPGLYVIEVKKTGYTFSRMLAYVEYNAAKTEAVDNTIVVAKGSENQVKKEITKIETTGVNGGDIDTSVAEGDEVEFRITDSYPYLDQTIENRKFEITDIVTGGTIVNNSIEVKFNNSPAGADDYHLTPNQNGFTITFGKKSAEEPYTYDYDIAQAGKTVTITYKVKVAAGDASLDNTVMSSISKYPNKPGETPGPEDPDTYAEVIIPKFTASVLKTDDSKEKNPLGGAKFTLYIETAKATATYFVTPSTETTGTIKAMSGLTDDEKAALPDTTIYLVEVTTGEGNAATPVIVETSSTDGKATFTGLDFQKKYWVAETTAPTGYSLSTVATKLTGASFANDSGETKDATKMIDGKTVKGKVTEYKVGTPFSQVDVMDTKLSSLPSTGGIGTTIFTIGGCAIMILAAGLHFASRRRSVK